MRDPVVRSWNVQPNEYVQAVVDFDALFEAARRRGGLDFIFTLVRVEGLSFGTPDPLAEAESVAPERSALPEGVASELLMLLGNLLRCAAGHGYRLAPPSGGDATGVLASAARDGGFEGIAEALESGDGELDRFLRDLLSHYRSELRAFATRPRLHKLPNFDVLELIVDEKWLIGFRIHFSNGEHAEFVRTETSTAPLNLWFDDEGKIGLQVGDQSALVSEWRIGGRPLYEVGLEGRYNKPGEWKPLVYPGDWDAYATRAREASERPEVQGALLYILLTAHHAVEFVARTSVDLPHEWITFGGGRLELFKVEPNAGGQVIYDGTVYVDAPEAEKVEQALRDVQALVNRIAFAFDASISWLPKYSTVQHRGGNPTPSDDDLGLLDHLLGAGTDSERGVIDEALDWYNRGRTATNVFVAFLCSYIAFESIAVAVWRDDVQAAVPVHKGTKAERRSATIKCIAALHDLLYDDDPRAFVERAYFECVRSLTQQVRAVAEAVFGSAAPATQRLFEKRDGVSLSSIRSSLAHGRLSLADPTARDLVRERLPEVQDVAREFLLRVALKLRPDEPVPQWSRLHRLGISAGDPRDMLCVSSLDVLPPSDWRIQAEWVSE